MKSFGRHVGMLMLITLACAGMSFLLLRAPHFKPHFKFYILSLSFFFMLSLLYFFIARLTLKSKNMYLFTRYSIVLSLIKILGGGALVFYYQQKFQPENKYYIIPFFLFYCIFTIYELFGLTRQNV